MSDATATAPSDKLTLIQRLNRDYSPLVVILVAVFAVVFLFGAATAENFLTWFNFKTIIRDAALVGIMAIGLTFVTLSGNFFLLSMKETAALSIIAFATCMAAGWGFPLSFVVTMAIALAAGAAQGALIGLGGNPIVVTLGAGGLFFGIGSWWSDNLVVSYRRPHGAEWLGTGSFIGDIPNITVAFVVIAIVAELVLRYTTFGRQVYLVGANRAAGRATGHENFGMAHGYDVIPNPLQSELDDTKRQLREWRAKIVCPQCKGNGRLIAHGPIHSVDSQCWKCRGDGLVNP